MGLTWEFTTRSTTTTFMDLTISIKRSRIITSIYSKPLSLHLYIPPNSCHAPGIARALIMGHTLRVIRLCSNQNDIHKELQLFYHRLIKRGHSPTTILPLLAKAKINARDQVAREKTITMTSKTTNKSNNALFYHLPFHPSNPPSSHIQTLWDNTIANPPNAKQLINLSNYSGHKIPISKLIVAYSRPPNLGNLLSCRKVKKQKTKGHQS